MARVQHGGGLAGAGSGSLAQRANRRILFALALACAMLCCGCAAIDPGPPDLMPVGSEVLAAPRGIVGETCPPALAAKGYC
jgi:hypothetical protein